LVFGIFVFGAAFWTLRAQPATTFRGVDCGGAVRDRCGILLGLTAEQLLNESLRPR